VSFDPFGVVPGSSKLLLSFARGIADEWRLRFVIWRSRSFAMKRRKAAHDSPGPASLGQASRISGIHPADLAVLLLYLDGPRCHPTSSTDQE